jgi:hypothetical protein
MKRIAIAAALVASVAAFSAAPAASDPSPGKSSSAESDQRSAPSWDDDEGRASRFAEGVLDRGRDGEHWDDEDDDDDGSASADRGGANRPVDPNASNAPVPDSGIFNGKARPKVEIQ